VRLCAWLVRRGRRETAHTQIVTSIKDKEQRKRRRRRGGARNGRWSACYSPLLVGWREGERES